MRNPHYPNKIVHIMEKQGDFSLGLLLVHCQGELGHVLMSGAPDVPGASMLEKMNHINTVDDRLRRFVTLEPRAHMAMSVNLLTAPCRADADAGFIVLQADRAHPMSGSNCMCVVTALLESGRIPMQEPTTVVRLDTPAGLVVARAQCATGKCLSVSLDNVPCFAEQLDCALETPRWGRIHCDIAFGGVYYALVDVAQIGLAIEPAQAHLLAAAGMEIKALLAGQVHVQHPTLAGVNEMAYVMFRQTLADGVVQTCTTLPPGRVDRSPCGTGSSAHMATLHARGSLAVGQSITTRSIIGGEFVVQLVGETRVGTHTAVLPCITGSAHVYGRSQLHFGADEPFAAGFALSDMFPV